MRKAWKNDNLVVGRDTRAPWRFSLAGRLTHAAELWRGAFRLARDRIIDT